MAFFKGRESQIKQVPTVTPKQRGGIDTLAEMAQQFPQLFESLGFDPTRIEESFQQSVARPAIRQFQEQIAPGIQERFIGAGAGRSSAGMRALSTAGERLEEGLAGTLAQQLQGGEQFSQQAQLQALMSALGIGLGTQTFQNVEDPGQQSGLMTLLPMLLQLAGTVGGGALAGPGGAAAGGAAGSAIGQGIF